MVFSDHPAMEAEQDVVTKMRNRRMVKQTEAESEAEGYHQEVEEGQLEKKKKKRRQKQRTLHSLWALPHVSQVSKHSVVFLVE